MLRNSSCHNNINLQCILYEQIGIIKADGYKLHVQSLLEYPSGQNIPVLIGQGKNDSTSCRSHTEGNKFNAQGMWQQKEREGCVSVSLSPIKKSIYLIFVF